MTATGAPDEIFADAFAPLPVAPEEWARVERARVAYRSTR